MSKIYHGTILEILADLDPVDAAVIALTVINAQALNEKEHPKQAPEEPPQETALVVKMSDKWWD